MKFDVEVEDYSDSNNNITYKSAIVSYTDRELHVYPLGEGHVRIEGTLYYMTSEYLKFHCYIPVRGTLNVYHSGEVTLRGASNE